MPNCSIKHCRAFKSEYQPELTFHKLPRNEKLKKKWLDAIGIENLNLKNKEHWVCSQHFKECEFNRTLEVVRLRENTVPSLFVMGAEEDKHSLSRTSSPLQSASQEILYLQTPKSLSDSIENDNEQDLLELDETFPQEKALSQSSESLSISDVNENDNEQDLTELAKMLPQSSNTARDKVISLLSESVAKSDSIENDNEQDLLQLAETLSRSQNTSQENVFSQMQQNVQTIEVLNEIRMVQRREIKQLNEKVRKRRNKIERLNKIIDDLKNINKINNEQPTVLIVLD